MTKRERREFAERIATELFTNGQGERAHRLVLEGAQNLGGWSLDAATDLIERLLPFDQPAVSASKNPLLADKPRRRAR